MIENSPTKFGDFLKEWLLAESFPVWWRFGADQRHGGFREELTLTGGDTSKPRRGRIQPRQIFCFAKAIKLDWQGPAEPAIHHGLDSLEKDYKTSDGTFAALADNDGQKIDSSTVLYDQAFVLLALAAVFNALPETETSLQDKAHHLFHILEQGFKNAGLGFFETSSRTGNVLANSHMHLFEAALEWEKCDPSGPWTQLADQIAMLAQERFGADHSDRIYERFEPDLSIIAGISAHHIEPGHQFEWAYLLLGWGQRRGNQDAMDLSARLFETGETLGVDLARQAAVSTILDDGTVIDPVARLWQQAERYRAALAMASSVRKGLKCPRSETDYLAIASKAAQRLRSYLIEENDQGWLPGLWHDKLTADSTFVLEPAPASSFYHILSALTGPIEHGHVPVPSWYKPAFAG